ncbi:MAG: type VI secretion system membrane subunit TssM [Proteobacteria bacterium]|nr:type VI secretion system membrane subunit TssM [Pseudomonadota bacterium]
MIGLNVLLNRITRSRWLRTFLGVVILSALIWFFGPLLGIGTLHPLESEMIRIIAIVVLVVLWIVENLIYMLRASRRDKKLAEGAAAQGEDPAAAVSAEEIALLADRLKQAMAALRKAKLGGSRRYLYQLPWYMFIGPPGAGKTTALLNCGLKFPLADSTGAGKSVAGVGGTRNCDWWFTDQAVLIDTAGRYTTQDSDSGVDSRAWLGFLGLLKRNRPRQPLNGVLVAISLSDLAALTEPGRLAHAQAIRKRIRELSDQLGVRVPVYVLFTKADLIAGFVEFFDSLGKEERDQVWGVTLPLDDGKSEEGSVGGFLPEFDALLTRLNDRMMERVHQETDLARRRLIWGFPQQIASMRDVANEFLTEIFRPSRLETRPLLRGIYFTSGTQDGTPIDRLLGAMAAQFSLPRQAVGAFSGAGRSYFLGRLVREVVFGEAGLVSSDPKIERRRRWSYIATYAVAALVLLLATGFWTLSYFGNREIIADAHAAAAKYDGQYRDLLKRGAQDTDIPVVLPALATLRDMPGGYAHRESETPIEVTFGLYQGQKITTAAIDAYSRALNGLLLPRLLARLEGQIRSHLDKADFLYEALKVYLILGRQGPLDRDLVEQWMAADSVSMLPGEDNAEAREAFLQHVHAMLDYPLTAIPLDGPLVAQAREILTRQPLSEYVYNRMLRSAVVQSLPEWTIADNAGPSAGRVFQLRDGKPLNTGTPGIFTWNGYHQVLLPLLPQVTKDASEDAWVLGRQAKGGVVGSVQQMNQLRRDVLALYLDDYTRRWDALLANVALKPFDNLSSGLEELFTLSAPDSPLRNLLQAIDTQTQLSRPPALETAASGAEQKAAKLGQKLTGYARYIARSGLSFEESQVASILGEAFGTDAATGKPVDPASRVDDHFRSLHEFVVGGKDKPPQLEAVIGKIQQVYQGLNQAANSPNQGQALLGMVAGGGAGGGSAAQQLQDLSQTVPKPIAAMLQTVSNSSSQVTASGAGTQLADAWRSKVLPLCTAAFNRYPFIAGSAQDVPLDDFVHLLGPGGLIDQFFDQYLKPVVDTTQLPWKWQAGGNVKLGLSQESLVQFQRASEIRDALFPTGGQQISVKFQLTPTQLDPGLAQVSVEVAGQRLSYAHGPSEPTAMQWPASNGGTQVRMTMTPTSGGPATVVSNAGPWALLRLMDAARVQSSGQPDKFHITFTSPAGSAGFELDASSVRNPFTMTAIRAFRCPPKL